MHFFKNSVSFIAVMCVCSAAAAAVVASSSSRVGVVSAASRRLPSLSNIVKTPVSAASTTTSSASTATGTGLISDTDCIDDYRECMKSDTACGPDFEECTTNVLFHGHMGECFSTLYQCSPAAIERLFGTSNLNALSDVANYVDGTIKKDANGNIIDGEIARYTYPTNGSVMGVDIIGAATRNKLNTSDCVKKYKRCLNKDNVCGEDFELCTSNNEFKKQAAMCDSTLARCQKEGFQQIFGEAVTTKPANRKLMPNNDGDAHQWIEDGAALAAANAVNTCYKVVDNCFANACAKNPYSCVEDVDWSVVNAAQSVGSADVNAVVGNYADANGNVQTGRQMATDVRKFFRAACTDTIGSNQYCYMTFNDGKKPSKTDLQDEDIREDIFGEAYASRKTILTTKVNELAKQFDTTARNKCIETFKSCAKQSCGGGSGAACYSRAFRGTSNQNSINNDTVYSDIENGCAAIVNTDANCRFMAAMQGGDTYSYQMGGNAGIDAFATLFPKYTSGNTDSTIVAALNADLSTAYNDVAIENMKKQCQNVVENCVKSMCGTDYINCYRNRNDAYASVNNSGKASFDRSMNRVGGVLDYTIVQGLCASTIRNSDVCAESLAIAKIGVSDGESDVTASWGSNNTTLTNAWRNSASMATADGLVNDVDADGKRRCECDNGVIDICADESGATNMSCTKPHRVSKTSVLENQAVATLFQDVLSRVEQDAQAQYNKKLTREQNICTAQNATGISEANLKSFVWAKLKNRKMPADYATNGLGDNGWVESNDLYNSFCRVKVTIQSEDKNIQAEMKNIPNAYFAVGDPFTCGAWISGDQLDSISETMAKKKTGTTASGGLTSGQGWGVAGITALTAIAGGVGTDLLQTKSGLGGLLGTTKIKDGEQAKKEIDKQIEECVNAADDVKRAAGKFSTTKKEKLKDGKLDANGDDTNVSNVSAQEIKDLNNYLATLRTKYRTVRNRLDVTKNEWENNKEALEYSFAEHKNENPAANAAANAAAKISQHCTDMKSSTEYTDKTKNGEKDFWNNGGGRAVMDVAGAAVLGTAGGITTAQIMKANNRANFTAEQQKWMDEIGSKIHCYVGGQLVGDFGDIVSVDISEE